MGPPSLCGSFLTNKRSVVALTWSLTTVLTLVAFCVAIVMTAHVHGHYIRMERYYTALWEYNQEQRKNNNGNGNGNNNKEAQKEEQREIEQYLQLGDVSSGSMVLVTVCMSTMALALSFYGSTTIVGFTSMRGVYIAPCFSLSTSSYHNSASFQIGIFGGAIGLFANALFVLAVLLGEVRVEDWTQQGNNNNNNAAVTEPYEVERIAGILAMTCMFLAPLYIIFALLLFLYHGGGGEYYSEDGSTTAVESSFYQAAATTAANGTTPGTIHMLSARMAADNSSNGGCVVPPGPGLNTSTGSTIGGGINNNNSTAASSEHHHHHLPSFSTTTSAAAALNTSELY